jgi:hypothetical protein
MEAFSCSSWEDVRMQYHGHHTWLSLARGDAVAALAEAEEVLFRRRDGWEQLYQVPETWVDGIEAALTCDERSRAAGILELLPAEDGELAPFMRAQRARFRARLAVVGDDEHLDGLFANTEDVLAGSDTATGWLARAWTTPNGS